MQADVTKPGDVERVIQAAVEKFDRIDILVNNAGVFEEDRRMRCLSISWIWAEVLPGWTVLDDKGAAGYAGAAQRAYLANQLGIGDYL